MERCHESHFEFSGLGLKITNARVLTLLLHRRSLHVEVTVNNVTHEGYSSPVSYTVMKTLSHDRKVQKRATNSGKRLIYLYVNVDRASWCILSVYVVSVSGYISCLCQTFRLPRL